MNTLKALLEELDGMAEAVFEAQMAYVGATMDAMEAEERLKDYEVEISAEAADKERHPELTNADLRKGFVVDTMSGSIGESYRVAHHGTLHNKLLAQAKYDRLWRRADHLQVIIAALKPEG